MSRNFPPEAQKIMNERFHHDSLIALATTNGRIPSVRTVNGYYEDGMFYVITDASSEKMKQIEQDPHVAICGDWFTAHGIGTNLGHILDEKNRELADRLRSAFAAWYHNGHIREQSPHTCILCIALTDGVLLSHGTRYDIDFTAD